MKNATLSLRQPFAQFIINGTKRYECRTWTTRFRGRVWIHASSRSPGADVGEMIDGDEYLTGACFNAGWFRLADLKVLLRSAIIGSVEIVDVIPASKVRHRLSPLDHAMCGYIAEDAFLWELRDPRMIAPISGINGKLNLWPLPDPIAHQAAAEPVLPRAAAQPWSLADEQEDWFAGFYRRRFTGPAARIPGANEPSPQAFWRAFGAWLDGLGAREPDAVVSRPDGITAALVPSGKPTRRKIVERAFSYLEAELDAGLASRVTAELR